MEKKKIDIIYNADLRQVQGINHVIKAFIAGNCYFKESEVYKVYSPNLVLNICQNESIPVGINIRSKGYVIKRKIRSILRIILTSKILLFAGLKFYINEILPAKRVIKKYNAIDGHFVIFQDPLSAYFYCLTPQKKSIKTILILHCGEDIYSQWEEQYPALFKSRYFRSKIELKFDYISENIDKVIFISKKALGSSLISKKKKEYIYNGISDICKFNPSQNDILNIVCVGSMNGHKGQELIIEALNLLNNVVKSKVHLYLIGAGSLESIIKSKVATYSLGNIVTLLGVRNDVDSLLGHMDLFVLPSISEGLPISIIEALRSGLYILTTDTGGTSEMIGDGFGEIITRDPFDIKTKIESVIKDDKISIMQKNKSRKYYIENFSLNKMIEKYEQVLFSLQKE